MLTCSCRTGKQQVPISATPLRQTKKKQARPRARAAPTDKSRTHSSQLFQESIPHNRIALWSAAKKTLVFRSCKNKKTAAQAEISISDRQPSSLISGRGRPPVPPGQRSGGLLYSKPVKMAAGPTICSQNQPAASWSWVDPYTKKTGTIFASIGHLKYPHWPNDDGAQPPHRDGKRVQLAKYTIITLTSKQE